MTTNKKIVQLALISFGFFLILATYLFYPKIYENKLLEKENIIKDNIVKTDDNTDNVFENVEYKGLYNVNNSFTVSSEKAYVLTEEPSLVFMTKMKVALHMNEGKVVIITSKKGKYNKETYDIFFIGNVKATDDKTIVLADNLDLLATEDLAAIYNNVILTNDNGSLQADKIDYDFETKYYQISMFDDEKVEVKLIK